MPLIFKGDTTDNFGRYLPSPFIEKIQIEDGGYAITFATFLTVEDSQDITEYREWLDSEIFCNAILATNKSPEGYENFVGGKNVFSYYEGAQGSNNDTSNIVLERLPLFSSDPVDEFYDEDGNRVLKFQYTIDGNSPSSAALSGGQQNMSGGSADTCTDAGDGNRANQGEGYCCNFDSQCSSGKCDDTYEGTASGITYTGKCAAEEVQSMPTCKSAEGNHRDTGDCCNGDSVCNSGNCNKSGGLYMDGSMATWEGKCTLEGCNSTNAAGGYFKEGDCCSSDSQCQSGACSGSGCGDLYAYSDEHDNEYCGKCIAAAQVAVDPATGCTGDASGSGLSNGDCCTMGSQCRSRNCDSGSCEEDTDGVGESVEQTGSSRRTVEQEDAGTADIYGTSDSYTDDGDDDDSGSTFPMSDTMQEVATTAVDSYALTSAGYQAIGSIVTAWEDVGNFYVLAFSTTFDWASASEDERAEKLENVQLFNREISGVSYEKVFEEGIIANQLQSEFFGRKGEIYNGAALQATSGKYYKTTKVTHDEVVNFFEKLVDEFKSSDDGENTPLQRMINQISYVLEVYPEDIELLRRLNTLRRAFPSKGGASPLGRLYKRYSKRLSTLNKKLYNSPEIEKRIIRNAKIFDLRSQPPLTYTPPDSYINLSAKNDEYYIYNTSFMGRTAMYSSVSGEQQTESNEGDATVTSTAVYAADSEYLNNYDIILRQFGYFFFDYEKALKNLANVNQIIDVSKFDIYGIEFPYAHFRIPSVSLTRESSMSDVVTTISSEMNSGYPITEKTTTEQTSDYYKLAITSPGFYTDYESEQTQMVGAGVSDAAVTEEGSLVLTEEEYMYLVQRNFEPVNKNGEITSLIPNYRLMCFEFQDFMDDDYSGDGVKEYTAKIEIIDDSVQALITLIDKFQSAIATLNSYKIKAEEQFSYDKGNDEVKGSGLFNEFFSEGMLNLYQGNMHNAPWYRVPVLYNMHRDLIYNYFGGDISAILADSQTIINNINPTNGSYDALYDFYNKVSDFYQATYIDGSIAYDISQLANASGYTFEIQNIISYDTAGNSKADEVSDMVYGTIYT